MDCKTKKINFIEKSIASVAIQQINDIKKNLKNERLKFSIFLGFNTLFSNLTIKENFLYQSHLQNLEELNQIGWSSLQRELIQNCIFDFENFYPKEIPEELLMPLSFLCTILQDTNFCLFRTSENISPEFQTISMELIKIISQKSEKIFINLDQSTDKNVLYLPKTNIIKLLKAS